MLPSRISSSHPSLHPIRTPLPSRLSPSNAVRVLPCHLLPPSLPQVTTACSWQRVASAYPPLSNASGALTLWVGGTTTPLHTWWVIAGFSSDLVEPSIYCVSTVRRVLPSMLDPLSVAAWPVSGGQRVGEVTWTAHLFRNVILSS